MKIRKFFKNPDQTMFKEDPKFHIWLGSLHIQLLIVEMQDYSD